MENQTNTQTTMTPEIAIKNIEAVVDHAISKGVFTKEVIKAICFNLDYIKALIEDMSIVAELDMAKGETI